MSPAAPHHGQEASHLHPSVLIGGRRAPASPASSGSFQRSLTSAAASKMKKALGLCSSASSKGVGSPGSGEKAALPRRPTTVGELMRVQMRVSEPADARIRRGLLRIAASQFI